MENENFDSVYVTSRRFEDWLHDPTNPLVYCLLTLDRKKFLAKNSYTVELSQKTADHDTFCITVPDDALDSFEGYVMENSKNLLGQNLTITYWRFGKEKLSFTGIIKKIRNKKDEGGGYGELYITGCSPSILLESGKDCQSFEDKTLEQIVKEITAEYPKEAHVEISSAYLNDYNTKSLPYTVQYKESDYQFIKRLAIRHGEFFYYNGEKLIFGNSVQPITKLGENIDLIDIEFEMQMQAQDFTFVSYDAQSGTKIEKDSGSIKSEFKESPFQSIAVNSSGKAFRKKPKMHFNHAGINNNSEAQLSEAVRLEKERRENLMQVRGKSKDPELKIGGRAELSDINKKAMETYRIIEITHHYNGEDYYNEFVGIPDLFNAAPYIDIEAVPKGEEQPARVTDNNDPMGMGRVKVQFPWQEDKNQTTPWIRLIQPHSGAGKGFHFIPEIGEEVLVGHESGNAEKPFVMGTHYNGGETSGYHTSGNDKKVIHTRSGIKIILNDAEGSVFIEDPSGNTYLMDGQGNIKVNAPQNISFDAGNNLDVNVGNNMTFNVGNTAMLNIMQKTLINTPFMQQLVAEYFYTQAGKALISSENEIKIEAKETNVAGTQKLFMHSDEKTIVNSKGVVDTHGKKGNNQTNKPQQYKRVPIVMDSRCIVKFRPNNSWAGEFGFDWMRIGDTSLKGDAQANKYRNISSNYNRLKNAYQQRVFTRKDSRGRRYTVTYFIPWLTLYPLDKVPKGFSHTQAKLDLTVDIEVEPLRLELDYDKSLFTLDKQTITPTSKGIHHVSLTVTCNKSFDKDKDIKVVSVFKNAKGEEEKALAGKIMVTTNKQLYKVDCVIVKVHTNLNGRTPSISRPNVSAKQATLKKYLRQALVNPIFLSEIDLDFRSDTDKTNKRTNLMTLFNGAASVSGGMIPNGSTDAIQNFLNAQIRAKYGNKYDNVYKFYFINEEAGTSRSPNKGLYGRSYGIPSVAKSVVIYKGDRYNAAFNDSTLVHEGLHAMGLHHSFDNSGEYTFTQDKTDNIMDYSDVALTPIPVVQLWHWQHKYIYPNVTKI